MAARPKFQSAILASLIAIAFQVLATASPIEDELVTRLYKLDIEKIQRLQQTTLADLAPEPKSSPANLLRAVFVQAGIDFPIDLTNLLRRALAPVGIGFPANLTNYVPPADRNQKGFYLNERTGELQLCATRRDIPKFEKYLEQLSPDPPPEIDTSGHVEFETVWVEIPLPSPPLLTLDPKPLGTNFASLIAFTNIAVLAPKTFRTRTNFPNFGTDTVFQLPTATVIISRRLRLPESSSAVRYKAGSLVVSPTISSGTLLIRGESDGPGR